MIKINNPYARELCRDQRFARFLKDNEITIKYYKGFLQSKCHSMLYTYCRVNGILTHFTPHELMDMATNLAESYSK